VHCIPEDSPAYPAAAAFLKKQLGVEIENPS
jgi:hypothetical protein